LLLAGAAVLALVLAFQAQQLLAARTTPLDGVIFYGVALALFVRTVCALPLPHASLLPRPAVAVAAARVGVRWPPAAMLAIVLSAAVFISAGGNTMRPLTLICWAGAILATLYVAASPRPDLRAWPRALAIRLQHPAQGLTLRVSWLAVVVVGLLLLAVFFHYFQINTIPSEPTSDHAEKLTDVQDVLDGWRPWFFPRNTGREPLQFYLTWPLAAWRGADHLTLKLITAGIGVLTVLFSFLLARVLFGVAVGLVTGFLVAVAHWEVGIARMGLRAPFGALFSALCLYLLFRALQSGRRADFLLLGLGLGAGLYGYTPFRLVVPLFVGLVLLLHLVRRWRDGPAARLDLARNALWAAITAAVVFLPLGRYMVEYPASFWERTVSRVAEGEPPAGGPVTQFLGNLKNAALMFNWQGDQVWVNAIPGAPVLDSATGALFVLGVAYAVVRLSSAREWLYGYLLLGLPVLTLASTAAIGWPGENPSVFRAGAAIPVVFLLAALPLVLTASWIRGLLGPRLGGLLAAAVLLGPLALIAVLNYQSYFVTYAGQYRLKAENAGEIGAVVRGFAQSVGDYKQAYHVPWPHWVDTRNIGFAAGSPRWNNALLTPDAIEGAARGPTPQLYILHPNDLANLERLRALRPEGFSVARPSAVPGHDFVVYFVPGAAR
jgi:hypothetical protein